MSELLQGPYTRAEVAAMFDLKPAQVPRNVKRLCLVKSHIYTEPTISRKRQEVWWWRLKTQIYRWICQLYLSLDQCCRFIGVA